MATKSAKIVGALLVRNEATPDRFLTRVLANVASFCDALVVVDDGSTDDTVKVCREAGAQVIERQSANGWWGEGSSQSEAPLRKLLWQEAVKEAGESGWLYIADADHELLGVTPAELRRLTRATVVTCFAFPLWDCWDSEETQRVDGFWQAWANPRPWLFRAVPTPGYHPAWQKRAIHTGHYPANFPVVPGLVPAGAGIRHLGYVKLEHRVAKHAKYLALA